MSEQVKRYDAVHIRYEDSNIRYGEGCEVEVVTARDYDALNAEAKQLRAQRDKVPASQTQATDLQGKPHVFWYFKNKQAPERNQ